MSVPSERYELMHRLRDRFDLEPKAIPPSLDFSTMVVPVVDTDEVLRDPVPYTENVSISAINNYELTLTPPAGYKYRVKGLGFFLASGTWSVSRAGIRRGTTYAQIPVVTSSSVQLWGNHNLDFEMLPGDLVSFYVSAYTGAGTLTGVVWYYSIRYTKPT